MKRIISSLWHVCPHSPVISPVFLFFLRRNSKYFQYKNSLNYSVKSAESVNKISVKIDPVVLKIIPDAPKVWKNVLKVLKKPFVRTHRRALQFYWYVEMYKHTDSNLNDILLIISWSFVNMVIDVSISLLHTFSS